MDLEGQDLSTQLDTTAINELLESRRRLNAAYVQKLEDEVKRGLLTRQAANDLLRAAGLLAE